MILPGKHLKPERSLLGVGAALLELLHEERTVSGLWDEYKKRGVVTFDWFILSLDLLYAMGAVEMKKGLLSRKML